MSAARIRVLGLYRKLLRQSSQFHNFNYRQYAINRVKSYFREKRYLSDMQEVERELQYGASTLELLQRQTSLSQMYSAPKLVVEKL